MPVPERRAALIQAALRVIARDGVAAATTRAIAAEANMSLASLHYAFESRDELIAYVVTEQTGAALQTIRPGTDLTTTIRDGLRAFLDVVAADPQRELAMFELTHYALRTPGMADAAKRQYEGYHGAAAQIVAAVGQLTGHTWQRPVDEMARILVTLTDGLTLRWLVDRDTEAAQAVIDFAAEALAALATPIPTPAPHGEAESGESAALTATRREERPRSPRSGAAKPREAAPPIPPRFPAETPGAAERREAAPEPTAQGLTADMAQQSKATPAETAKRRGAGRRLEERR